ncbi:MAG: hypothetical protein EBV15_10825 [Bacteroidetes bacterium]|nr:hypothetical protein [Bacteroidota bacterium]
MEPPTVSVLATTLTVLLVLNLTEPEPRVSGPEPRKVRSLFQNCCPLWERITSLERVFIEPPFITSDPEPSASLWLRVSRPVERKVLPE